MTVKQLIKDAEDFPLAKRIAASLFLDGETDEAFHARCQSGELDARSPMVCSVMNELRTFHRGIELPLRLRVLVNPVRV